MFKRIAILAAVILSQYSTCLASQGMVDPMSEDILDSEFTPAVHLHILLEELFPLTLHVADRFVQDQEATDLLELGPESPEPERVPIVRFAENLEVVSFLNPRTNEKDKKSRQYILPLSEEYTYAVVMSKPTGLRLYRGIFPKPKKEILHPQMSSQQIAETADFHWNCSKNALSNKEPFYSWKGMLFMKETSAATAALDAARWYGLIPHAYEHEAEISREEIGADELEDLRLRASNNYLEALKVCMDLSLEVIKRTQSLKEFHGATQRLVKAAHALRHGGCAAEATRYINDLEKIARPRMKVMHSNDSLVLKMNKVVSTYAHLKKQRDHWFQEVEKIKASKGKKNHRTARLAHAKNMLEETEKEVKWLEKRYAVTLSRDWVKEPLYMCEEKRGCPDCQTILRDIEEWTRSVQEKIFL